MTHNSSGRQPVYIGLEDFDEPSRWLRQLMLPSGTAVNPSEDIFSRVVCAFRNCKQKGIRAAAMNDLLEELLGQMEISLESYERNFPIYIATSYLLSREPQYMDQCNRADRFVETCAHNVENIRLPNIAVSVRAFLATSCIESHCELLQNAFLHFAKLASVVKDSCPEVSVCSVENFATFSKPTEATKILSPDFMYRGIIWVSLALMCHSKLTVEADNSFLIAVWNECFVKHYLRIVLNEETVSKMRIALKFHFSLELPQHCQLSGEEFVFLAVKGDAMRPFAHMRNYFDALMERDLVTPKQMQCLYRTYEKWLRESIICSQENCTLETLKEGLELVELINMFYDQKNSAAASCSTEIQNWLNILLQLVDVTRGNSLECLKLFLCGKYKAVIKHGNYISSRLVPMVQKNFRILSVEQLLQLYKSFPIWPDQFLSGYLLQCRTDHHVHISDKVWQLLLQEIASSCQQGCILTFLNTVSSHYKDVQFILEMLQVNVTGLFETDELRKHFMAFLKTHIRTSVPYIQRDLPKIFDAVQDNITAFHKMVLDVIYEVVYNMLDTVSGHIDCSTLEIIKCKIMTSSRILSPCQEFCCKIMTAYCQTVPISSTSLLWMQSHLSVIKNVGEICFKIDQRHRSNVEVSKCIEFLRRVGTVLETWCSNLKRKQITHDHMLQYANCYTDLVDVANALHSKSDLLLEPDTLGNLQKEFMEQYEKLNIQLIKYVPGYPELWCTLSSLLETFGIAFPPDIQNSISMHVTFPGRNAIQTKQHVQSNLVPNVCGQLKCKTENALCITKETTLKDLIHLNENIRSFLQPISECLDVLVFFQLHSCKLFSNYFQIQFHTCKRNETVKSPSESVMHSFPLPAPSARNTSPILQCLQEAVSNSKIMLYELLNGTARYAEMTGGFSLDLTRIDVENEINVLSLYFSLYEPQMSQEGLSCIRDILQLLKVSVSIQKICNVCEQYQLQGCLADSQLKELISIADGLINDEKKADLTPAVAAHELKKLCSILCLSPKSDFACFKLFSAAASSAEFYKFITEKKYIGPKGRQVFQQQYQLVTAQLQHEQYNDTILNHLYAAYELIVLFTDQEQSLHDLMSAIASVNDICAGLKQLETVNANISQIYLWFSNTEEDSMQVLEAIIGTGYYEYCLDSQMPEFQLCFTFATPQPLEEKWKIQQVNEFIAKLGFIDSSRDVKCHIKRFYHVHEAALTVLNLYLELKSLGHPTFVNEQLIQFPLCSTTEEYADLKVKDLLNEAQKWSKRVTFLRSQHKWLLFFPIPKILILYKMIKTIPLDVARIVQEVSILISNTQSEQENLCSIVQPAVIDALHAVDSDPLETVGVFLDTLFLSRVLPIPRVRTLPRSEGSHVVLHRLHGCSNAELIQLIFTIYDGIPEPFEVFYCQNLPTQNELDLFLERALRFPRQYVMLEVNKLPYHLQEHLLHISGSLKCSEHGSCIHLIESAPSMLGEMPGVLAKDGEGTKPMDEVQIICLHFADLRCVKVVYGHAGGGKSHYIMEQLSKYSRYAVITINEAFTPLLAIEKLRSLNSSDEECSIYFNVTMLPSQVPETNRRSPKYSALMKSISWFFFDLLILGYVEDRKSGLSFRIPRAQLWSIYIEVPFCGSPKESYQWFKKEIPTLELLGSSFEVQDQRYYRRDASMQMVCKYLRALKNGDIDRRVYKEGGPPVKFSLDPDLNKDECKVLLEEKMPKSIQNNKITQRLFIEYMKRRCCFIEKIPAFIYNTGLRMPRGASLPCTDTCHLGSTLMTAMLSEVLELCQSDKTDWSSQHHKQLVYDCVGGGGSISLITLHPEKLTEEEKTKFSIIGITISPVREQYSAEVLHGILSKALGIPLDSTNHLKAIVESNYVLTLDYALKMLAVNERWKCGVPVIIEGETGVGKTALIEVLSKLWNCAIVQVFEKTKKDVVFYLQQALGELEVHENIETYICIVQALSSGGVTTHDDMLRLCNLQHGRSGRPLYLLLYERVLCGISKHKPLVPLLELSQNYEGPCLEDCLTQADLVCSSEAIADVLHALFSAHIKSTFLKVNVHAALTPSDIRGHLQPAFALANELKSKFDALQATTSEFVAMDNVPFVTIFFDEMNASSCPGLFKEIIVDKTFHGEPIPSNLFIVAACNPHRGNSLAFKQHSWVRGSYSVHQLPPTLRLLTWDYGSLNTGQENDYICEKLKLLNKDMSSLNICSLTSLISQSQNAIREFSREHLINCGATEDEAFLVSKSSVSQRDIQRVITLYEWLMCIYHKYKQHGQGADYNRRAVLVAIGVVYYMRLDQMFRTKYIELIDRFPSSNNVTFLNAFHKELDWFSSQICLPPGIARTEVLKENLFAVTICTSTQIPLIIVGPPGSSKTLSFNLVISNLKGKESKSPLFRDVELFPSLTPYHYQCSRQSTSSEIDTVFQRAINRQNKYCSAKLPMRCVVCIDEAGLPDERHESLKVLHYYLDNPAVSFVATSNHMLDAAKTNRAITLYRSETSKGDLITLAKGCFYNINDSSSPNEMRYENDVIAQLCSAYAAVMTKPAIKKFFGLRDFIYFIYYLRNHRSEMLSPQVIMEGLERNFNGSDHFDDICKAFLPNDFDRVRRQNIVDVIRASTHDAQSCIERSSSTGDDHVSNEVRDHVSNEVRYKLFIDASEDESLMRFLFAFNILKQQYTKFICMDYSADHSQKVSVIATVRKYMAEGKTVVMSQSDAIHESFYDLFNQRFRRIDDPNTGVQYYANIAIGDHTKPCKVHPHFQCVVVIKKSDVEKTAAPLLNRFEKYFVTHSILLEAALNVQPPCLRDIVLIARSKVIEFAISIGGAQSLCGFQDSSTVDSLILSMLPSVPDFTRDDDENMMDDGMVQPVMLVLQRIIAALRVRAGFSFSSYLTDTSELTMDAQYLLRKAVNDVDFESIDVENLTEHSVHGVTNDGLSLIFDEGSHVSSIMGRFAIKLTTMWLILYLCKRLMQLMTTTGLIVHLNGFPPQILESYLHSQAHFSMKHLLKRYVCNKRYSPTKILCFSSCLTTSELSKVSALNEIDPLQANAETSIAINNLSCLPSESIRNCLDQFVSSNKRILLLVANMDEVSHAKLNYVRILIEESESSALGQRKLFVVLIGYPTQLSCICYPSLFLNGWDHTFVHGLQEVEDGFNLRHWVVHCCTPTEADTFAQSLRKTIKKSLADMASTVSHTLSFAFQEDILHMSNQIKHLLLKTEVGSILCAKFVSYFEQRLVLKYLRNSVQFVNSCGASRGILESMQTAVLNDFANFLIIMMSKITANCNLEAFLQNYDLFQQLFFGMVQLLPLPEFKDISFLSGTLPSCIATSAGCFPFFQIAFDEIESIIEVSCERDKIHSYTSNLVVNSLNQKVLQNITELLHKDEASVIKVFMASVQYNDELWSIYFDSFLSYKYDLNVHTSNQRLKDIIVKAYFGDLGKMKNIDKVVWLHLYSRVHDLDLFKVIRLLGQIITIYNLESDIYTHFRVHKPAFALMPLDVTSTQHLSPLAIQVLFNYLVAASQDLQEKCGCSNAMTGWYNHYKDMMMVLGNHIDITLKNSPERSVSATKLNIMQTIFMTLQFVPESNLVAERIFNRLCSQHFGTNMELTTYCGLQSISHAFEGLKEEIVGLCSDETQVCRAIEGLLDHFFPSQRLEYEPEDVQCLFELANRQHHWCNFNDETQGPYQHSLETFKLYLSRILRDEKHANQPGLFKKPCRDLLLRTLVQQSSFLGSNPFVPCFYTNMSSMLEETLHQTPTARTSPLAHLYFVTLLESFQAHMHTLPDLMNTAMQMMKCCKASNEEVILLNIEFQVVLQSIIQQVAECLNPRVEISNDGRLYSEIGMLQDEINRYLSDPNRGGGPLGCHHFVLSLFLLRKLNSTQRFIGLMTKSYDARCRQVLCLELVHEEMMGLQSSTKSVFVLLEKDMLPQFATVKKMLFEIHGGKGSSVKDLIKQAQKINSQFRNKHLFSAMVWLAVYYEFFKKKIPSPELSRVLEEQSLSGQLGSQCYVNLLKCFLAPKESDPHIHDLLLAHKESSDWELRDCVANLIAVVMCCSNSSHLWHHTFAPAELVGTQSSCLIHGSKAAWTSVNLLQQLESVYFYDVGLGTCSLSSFYFLLWVEFGGLCVSLVCEPSAASTIQELLGSSESPHRYCVSRLRSMWRLIEEALSLSDEERLHLLNCILKQIFQCQISSSTSWLEKGCFTSDQELRQFLALWDSQIYQPALSTAKRTVCDDLYHLGSALRCLLQFPKCESRLLKQLRVLNYIYPQPLKRSQFLYQIISQLRLDQQKEGGEFHLLTRVAFEWNRLKAGESILTQLIQFYSLLHSQLAYSLTDEEMQSVSISDAICKHTNLQDLFDKIKDGYNSYIEISEKNKMQKIPPLSDSSPLVVLLSDPLKRAEFKDYLFAVISDISTLHNDFLAIMLTSQYLSHLAPTKPSLCTDLLKISDDCCLTNRYDSFHGVEDLLPLLHRLSVPSTAALSEGPFSVQVGMYDLKRFQEDIVLMYMSGKHKIDCTDQKKKQFLVKNTIDENTVALRSLVECHLPNSLPTSLKTQLSHTQKQEIEVEFHSANLNTITKVIQGLQIAIEFTVQNDPQQETSNQVTLVSFVQSHSNQSPPMTDNIVLSRFGLYGLSSAQERVLKELPLCCLLSTVQLFNEWVENERCEFCELPFVFKSHMNAQDLSTLQQLDRTGKGDLEQLYEHLVTLNSALVFFQGKLAKESFVENQTIANFMQSLFSAEKRPQFLNLIPMSIKIQCYVSFALAVRQMQKRLANELAKKKNEQDKLEQWNDSVVDLWKRLEAHIIINHPEDPTPIPKQAPSIAPASIVPALPIPVSEISGSEYSADDVASFLQRIGMSEHVQNFLREGITGYELLTASDELLKELGVHSALQRRKLRKEFEKTIRK